jgi:hypothetical protein
MPLRMVPLRQRPVGKELSSRRQSVDAQESSSDM